MCDTLASFLIMTFLNCLKINQVLGPFQNNGIESTKIVFVTHVRLCVPFNYDISKLPQNKSIHGTPVHWGKCEQAHIALH